MSKSTFDLCLLPIIQLSIIFTLTACYNCDLICNKEPLKAKHSYLICEKGPLLKHPKKPVMYTYSCYIYTAIYYTNFITINNYK